MPKRLASLASVPRIPVFDAADPLPEPSAIHHTISVLEVDLVYLQYLEPNELGSATANIEQQVVRGLFRNFTNGNKMFRALQVIESVSRPRDNSPQELNLDVTPFSMIEGASPMTRMLKASRLAHQFLERSDIHQSLLRLKVLMCYITLHLTLEHAIVPQLKHENPKLSPKHIAGMKYSYFYNLLEDEPGTEDREPPPGFRRHIDFGKTFWSFVQETGVAALLMLAAADTGLTIIARAIAPKNKCREGLISALSCSRAWWSFAHAIGPSTLRTCLGPRNIHYTVPQLLQQLCIESLPTASILQINQSCRISDLEITINPQIPNEMILLVK